MSPKILPSAVLMPEYEALLREGAALPLVVSGESMLPFLRPGRDTVYLREPDGALRAGDIAFFRRKNGDYILHRVVRAEKDGYWFLGDAQTRAEGPMPASCIIAAVTAVRRDERLIRPESPVWRFYAGPWQHMHRQRRILMRIYRILHRRSRRGSNSEDGM